MERVRKQRHGPLSAIRHLLGSPSPPADRAPHSGEGFNRWLREFEMQNRAAVRQAREKFRQH